MEEVLGTFYKFLGQAGNLIANPGKACVTLLQNIIRTMLLLEMHIGWLSLLTHKQVGRVGQLLAATL